MTELASSQQEMAGIDNSTQATPGAQMRSISQPPSSLPAITDKPIKDTSVAIEALSKPCIPRMFSMFGIGPPTANEIGTNTKASSQKRQSRSTSRKLRPDATAAARAPAAAVAEVPALTVS